MPLTIVRNDITKLEVDAIVNAANTQLLMGGGVCGAIFSAAGADKLQKVCDKLAPINTGDAVITKGFALRAKYVIHTAGPVYHGGTHNEESLLRACYRNALNLAGEHRCESIAFPIISSGIYGYPKAEALSVATGEIGRWLLENEMDVYLVVYDKEAFAIMQDLLNEVKSFIDENYVDEKERLYGRVNRSDESTRLLALEADECAEMSDMTQFLFTGEYQAGQNVDNFSDNLHFQTAQPLTKPPTEPIAKPPAQPLAKPPAKPLVKPPAQPLAQQIAQQIAQPPSRLIAKPSAKRIAYPSAPLGDVVEKLDEPFSSTLLRLIDAKGKSDVEVYKRANLDRKLFSKIRTGRGYMPSKKTAVALAVSLELSLDETRDLLERAGFALSRSVVFDVIIEYFITRKRYDIFEINNVLFEYDQPLLGG